MRKIAIVSINGLTKLITEGRFLFALVINLVLIKQLTDSVKNFSELVGIKCSPWLFPFLMQENYIQFIFIAGATLLFCDAPFIDHETNFEIIRTGRLNWIMGKELYILAISFIYSIFIMSLSTLLLLPDIQMQSGWGKVLNTLAQTNAASAINNNYLNLDYHIIQRFTPMHASLLCLVLMTVICFLVGLCALFINIFFKKTPGAVGGIVIALLPYFQRNFSNLYKMSFFSPASWMDISLWNTKVILSYPSQNYMIGYLLCCILFFSIASAIKFQKIDDLGRERNIYE